MIQIYNFFLRNNKTTIIFALSFPQETQAVKKSQLGRYKKESYALLFFSFSDDDFIAKGQHARQHKQNKQHRHQSTYGDGLHNIGDGQIRHQNSHYSRNQNQDSYPNE